MQKVWLIAACAVFSATLAGCSKDVPGSVSYTLRALNAVPDAEALDVIVDNNVKVTGLAVGATSGYESVGAGTHTVKIRSSTTGVVLVEKSIFVASKHTALMIYGRRSAISVLTLNDETGSPSSGKAKVRAVNLSAEAEAVDVYLGTVDLASATATLSSIAYESSIDFAEVTGGSQTLAITAAGTKDVRFQSTGQSFAAGSIYTVAVLASGGGQLANAVVIGDAGGTFIPNSLGRVKAMNAMGDATVVTFKADGAALLSNVPVATSPGYVALAATNHSFQVEAVNVPGVAIASIPQAVGPARDYTLLAVGSAGQAGLVALTDDNSVPASGNARVRFVNGLSVPADVLVNLASQASGLSPRTASPYFSIAAGTDYTITFSNPGGIGVLATLSSVELVSGYVYTVYLLGNPAAPSAVLVRDR